MNKYLWQQRLRGCIRPEFLTQTEYVVLTMLASYTNKAGRGAAPAAATLADDCGKNVKTIRRLLTSLVEKGYLSVTNPGGGRNRPTEYALIDRMPHEAGNVDTQLSMFDDLNVDTQVSTISAPKRGHSETETWTSDDLNVDTWVSTDQVDQERNQENGSAATSPTSTRARANNEQQPHIVSTHFSDDVPIPPEPPNNDPPPAHGNLALVYDADAIPTEIHSDTRPARLVITDATKTLVRLHVPTSLGLPRVIRAALEAEVQKLANDRHVQRCDIESGLREWAARPGAGPRLLPNLVADAARARTAQPATPKSKMRTLAELAHEERLHEQQHPRQELT